MQQVNEPLNERLLRKLKSKESHQDCSDPNLTLNDCALIQRELDKNRTLTSISFGDSNIDTVKLKILVGCTTLQTLILINNDLGFLNAEILSYQSHLSCLILFNTKITTQGATIIARNNSTLTYLDVSDNNIDNSGLTVITQIPSLRELRFANNAPNVLSSLPANSTLSWIDLSHNVVTSTALTSLLQFSSLTSLVFTNNKVGSNQASLFVSATSLTSLQLTGNTLGNEGAKVLALSPSLTSLDLSENNVNSEGAMAFSKNTILTNLDINPYLFQFEIDKVVQTKLDKALDCNRNATHQRKKEFVWKMIALARDAKNSNSQSTWHNLPADIRLCILLQLDLWGSDHVGQSKETTQKFARFIFDNINTYNSYLQRPILNTRRILISQTTKNNWCSFKFSQNPETLTVEQKKVMDSSKDDAVALAPAP